MSSRIVPRRDDQGFGQKVRQEIDHYMRSAGANFARAVGFANATPDAQRPGATGQTLGIENIRRGFSLRQRYNNSNIVVTSTSFVQLAADLDHDEVYVTGKRPVEVRFYNAAFGDPGTNNACHIAIWLDGVQNYTLWKRVYRFSPAVYDALFGTITYAPGSLTPGAHSFGFRAYVSAGAATFYAGGDNLIETRVMEL